MPEMLVNTSLERTRENVMRHARSHGHRAPTESGAYAILFVPTLIAILLSTLATVAAAADNTDALAEFSRNRAKWNAAEIRDYEIRLRDEACWCMFGPAYGPIRNIIKSGRIQAPR